MSEALKNRQLDLAKTVQDHALEHYGDKKARWDVLVECWTLEEIAADMTKAKVFCKTAAIRYWHKFAKLQHEAYLNTEAHLHEGY